LAPISAYPAGSGVAGRCFRCRGGQQGFPSGHPAGV